MCFFIVQIECNDNLIDLNDLKSKLPEGFKIPDALQNRTLPSVDDIKNVFQDKCTKVLGNATRGEEQFTAITEGASELATCTVGLINVEQLQKEIDDAKPIGELDTVFYKYNFLNNFHEIVITDYSNDYF